MAAVALVAASCIITVFFGAAKIAEGRTAGKNQGYNGVVTVWQIDTFEGGVGSRRQFLANRAKEFSQKNKGVLFLVTSHTNESAENNFKNGVFPDILSFGCGASFPSAEMLGENLYFSGGSIGEKTFATPWCRGSYFLIKHGKFSSEKGEASKILSSVIVSKGEYTLPLMTTFLEGFSINGLKILTPINAYKEFTLGKTPYLLGTQRDIARLRSRGENFSYTPLNSFCDLYQYAAVTTTSPEKKTVAENFLNYLINNDCQNKLKDIFMMPVKTGCECAEELKSAYVGGNISTVSAFTSRIKIEETALNLSAYYSGEKSLEPKIKNVLL